MLLCSIHNFFGRISDFSCPQCWVQPQTVLNCSLVPLTQRYLSYCMVLSEGSASFYNLQSCLSFINLCAISCSLLKPLYSLAMMGGSQSYSKEEIDLILILNSLAENTKSLRNKHCICTNFMKFIILLLLIIFKYFFFGNFQ